MKTGMRVGQDELTMCGNKMEAWVGEVGIDSVTKKTTKH